MPRREGRYTALPSVLSSYSLQLKTLSLVFFPFYSDYYCWKVSLPFRR